MDANVLLVITAATIIFALFYAYTNGANDAGSLVATAIACKAAKPATAVIYASALGFAGAIVGGSAVAATIYSIVGPVSQDILVLVLFSTAIAAVSWNLLSSVLGLPSSSTDAMVGGLVGAGIAAGGIQGVNWGFEELFTPPYQLVGVAKVLVFLVFSVALGFFGGYLAMKSFRVSLRNSRKDVNKSLRRSQWVTSGLLAIAHGANDTQKQMAIITLALLSAGYASSADVSGWTRFACALAIALGTLGGGWRIQKTLGSRIYRIAPVHSLSSQASSAASILISTGAGSPVSTSQVVSSSVVGVGAAENSKLVHWQVGKQMVFTWLVTMPVSAIISAVIFVIANSFVT